MGKKKNAFKEKLKTIEQVRRQMEKERKKIVVECAHQNDKGKLKIYPVNEFGEYECKYCKTRFNMNPIPSAELDEAIKTIHDAIQQISCYSDIDEDDKLIRLLGELDFNLQETAELYERVVSVYGRGTGKKKHKDEYEFGAYGTGALSFIGGKKK